MEQLEVHSRSYLVRWVEVKAEHTISWSVQPHKKSINFGIFKHPGGGLAPTPKTPSSSFETPATPDLRPKGEGSTPDVHGPHDGPSPAVEKLKSIGMVVAQWHGNCEANVVTSGTYDVGKGGAGMYALVFDNTFSKSLSKTATFVLLTYPTNAAAQTHHQVRHSYVGYNSTASLKGKARPKNENDTLSLAESSGMCARADIMGQAVETPKSFPESNSSSKLHTGTLLKRRRKRHQGYARRFFTLDMASNTLSYYHNRRTLSIRGAVPLSLAAIATNDTSREISIDSGAEIWHLRAINKKDYAIWKDLLEQATRSGPTDPMGPNTVSQSAYRSLPATRGNVEERDWQRVEELISRISVSRDTARRLARDTDPRYLPLGASLPGKSTSNLSGYASSSEASPIDFSPPSEEYFHRQERRSFWKRKTSGGRPNLLMNGGRKVSAPSSLPPNSTSRTTSESRELSTPQLSSLVVEEGIHSRCMELMQALDTIVGDFSNLMTENKQRRQRALPFADSRLSMESSLSQEFFDANAGDTSQIFTIQQDSDGEEQSPEPDFVSDEHEESSASEVEEDDARDSTFSHGGEKSLLFPPSTKSFKLPSGSIQRRTAIPPAVQSPPSLISFFRKNIGKDLSTIAMPVSANEPISLLQKMAEQMEYSELLDEACSTQLSPTHRILHIAAYAVTSLSSNRAKERSIRKPFNPMLGETYQLIREDRGYRFLAEKISHRPVRIAWQAEASNWSINQTTTPTQKFWGKSMELILDGRVRLSLHATGDRYSWTPATSFLRNIIAGEKYVEPVNSMTIHDENNGLHAVVEFAKAKGLFAGRSEDLTVNVFRHGEHTPLPEALVGKWTAELRLCSATTGAPLNPTERPVWTVGTLVPSASKCYGFTTFAAGLNEILERDIDSLPPSDSRLRQDQRSAEEGDLETAETLKLKLEENQRERRRVMEATGERWEPAWFFQVEDVSVPAGEEVWRMKAGKDGYWESLTRKDWTSARKVLDL